MILPEFDYAKRDLIKHLQSLEMTTKEIDIIMELSLRMANKLIIDINSINNQNSISIIKTIGAFNYTIPSDDEHS